MTDNHQDYDAMAEMMAMGYTGMYPPEFPDVPEGEDVAAIIAVMEDWYQALQQGTANKRLPDPQERRFSDKECEKLISIIDDYIQWELDNHVVYWSNYSPSRVVPYRQSEKLAISQPALLKRLEGSAREAFAQDVDRQLKETFGTGLFEKGADHRGSYGGAVSY